MQPLVAWWVLLQSPVPALHRNAVPKLMLDFCSKASTVIGCSGCGAGHGLGARTSSEILLAFRLVPFLLPACGLPGSSLSEISASEPEPDGCSSSSSCGCCLLGLIVSLILT